MNNDPHRLSRFLQGQEQDYAVALGELRSGRKESHWIWFIFPQFVGLGRSSTAEFFAIRTVAEAEAYLNHPILGFRLGQCADALLKLPHDDIGAVMSDPDDLKLKSSMTLFAFISPHNSVFHAVLAKFFGGELDELTLTLVQNC